ncbi:MAG: glycosyl hydrolase 53 family protein [Eubacteriales bacterium]|nr:glycosyl hydrolase 53 family protein [Eubacteriales bacterium]
MIIGICHGYGDYNRIKDCGFEWDRIDCPFPYDKETGEISEHYIKFKEHCNQLHKEGFKVMAISPVPVWAYLMGGFDMREPGGYDKVRDMHRFIAEDLKGYVDGWQVGNEINVYFFRTPYDFDQAILYIEAGVKGIRDVDKEILLGYNFSEYDETSIYMIEKLNTVNDLCDYMGLDAYHGTWIKGTPDDLIDDVNKLHQQTGKPVLIQEFGFASVGDIIQEGELDSAMSQYGFKDFDEAVANCELYLERLPERLSRSMKGIPRKEWEANLRHHEPHILKKWVGGSDKYPHTLDGQAKWLGEVIEKLGKTSCVIGFMLFAWSDAGNCFFCGAPDCPCETAWGLIDNDNKEKPSFYAVKEAIKNI